MFSLIAILFTSLMDFHEAAGNTFAFDSDSEHDVTTVYWTQAPK